MQLFNNSDITYNANRSNESEIPDLSKNEETSLDIHHVQQTKDYLNKTNTIENTNNWNNHDKSEIYNNNGAEDI